MKKIALIMLLAAIAVGGCAKPAPLAFKKGDLVEHRTAGWRGVVIDIKTGGCFCGGVAKPYEVEWESPSGEVQRKTFAEVSLCLVETYAEDSKEKKTENDW